MVLLPYILVPLLTALLKKRTSVTLTYVLTVGLLFFYPQIWFYFEEMLYPRPAPSAGGRCYVIEFSFWMMHFIFLLPGAILFQILFNWLLFLKVDMNRNSEMNK